MSIMPSSTILLVLCIPAAAHVLDPCSSKGASQCDYTDCIQGLLAGDSSLLQTRAELGPRIVVAKGLARGESERRSVVQAPFESKKSLWMQGASAMFASLADMLSNAQNLTGPTVVVEPKQRQLRALRFSKDSAALATTRSVSTRTRSMPEVAAERSVESIVWLMLLVVVIMGMIGLIWTQSSDVGTGSKDKLLQGSAPAGGNDKLLTRFRSTVASGASTSVTLAPAAYGDNDRPTQVSLALPIPPPVLGRSSVIPAPTALSLSSGAPCQLPPTAGRRPSEMPVLQNPPPICPSLVLPNTEARFLVAMDELQQLVGSAGFFDLRGTSGRTLLHGSVHANDGKPCLQIASVGCEQDPRCSVYAVTEEHLSVFGRHGRLYGALEASDDRSAVLHWSGSPVMRIEMTGAADLRMIASAVGGRTLASAGSIRVALNAGALEETQPIREHWRLQVQPNADAVLIASCMLGLHLLLPNASVLSNPRLSAHSLASQFDSAAPRNQYL